MVQLPTFDPSAVKDLDKLPPKPSGRKAAPSPLSDYIKSAVQSGRAKEFPPLSDLKKDGEPSEVEAMTRELRRAARIEGVKVRIRLSEPMDGDEMLYRVISFEVMGNLNPNQTSESTPDEAAAEVEDESQESGNRRNRRARATA